MRLLLEFGDQLFRLLARGEAAAVVAGGGAQPTTNATDTFQIRMRVQRDF